MGLAVSRSYCTQTESDSQCSNFTGVSHAEPGGVMATYTLPGQQPFSMTASGIQQKHFTDLQILRFTGKG